MYVCTMRICAGCFSSLLAQMDKLDPLDEKNEFRKRSLSKCLEKQKSKLVVWKRSDYETGPGGLRLKTASAAIRKMAPFPRFHSDGWMALVVCIIIGLQKEEEMSHFIFRLQT